MVEEAAQEFPGIEHCVTAPLGVHTKIGEVILERAGVPQWAEKAAGSRQQAASREREGQGPAGS